MKKIKVIHFTKITCVSVSVQNYAKALEDTEVNHLSPHLQQARVEETDWNTMGCHPELREAGQSGKEDFPEKGRQCL